MKNRKILYVLLPLAILLWGIIIYRIIIHLRNSNSVFISNSEDIVINNEVIIEDTFLIHADYKDPFIERSIVSIVADLTAKNIRPQDARESISQSSYSWPAIRYGGMIMNKSSDTYLYLIEIENNNLFVKKGDVIGMIEIREVFKDSIIVGYKKHKKVIYKQAL
jgi:hypothetical protein